MYKVWQAKEWNPLPSVVSWKVGGLNSAYALQVQTTSAPWVCPYIFHSFITQAFEKYSYYLKITPKKQNEQKRVGPRSLLRVVGMYDLLEMGNLRTF